MPHSTYAVTATYIVKCLSCPTHSILCQAPITNNQWTNQITPFVTDMKWYNNNSHNICTCIYVSITFTFIMYFSGDLQETFPQVLYRGSQDAEHQQSHFQGINQIVLNVKCKSQFVQHHYFCYNLADDPNINIRD